VAVRLVIADTSPINYLVLIGCIDLLPKLFDRIVLPFAVWDELCAPGAPATVRKWISSPPSWLEIQDAGCYVTPLVIEGLDEGETAAIALAMLFQADLLLMDERAGALAAEARGIPVTGTLGVLDRAAAQGMVQFAEAIEKLEATNFRKPAKIVQALLAKHRY
jgi:predicted nucleic acid-binding protein